MNTHSSAHSRAVIVGGGFAGIRAALDLSKNPRFKGDITLLSNKRNFEYYPALYRMIIGYPSVQVALPLEEVFAGTSVRVVVDAAVRIDAQARHVIGESGSAYEYDYLALGLGSETVFFGVEGLEEHVFPFKSVREAFSIHDRLHQFFRTCHKMEHKHVFLPDSRIVVIGGGPTGVEVAAELATHAEKLAKRYGTHIVPEIILIEAGPRVLPMMPEDLSYAVERKLRALGVRLMIGVSVIRQDAQRIYLKDAAEPIESRLAIWTAGVKPASFYHDAGLFSFAKGGRVSVDQHLRAEGQDRIFVMGDAAATPYAGSAQTALADGAFAAAAIALLASGGTPPEYRPKKPVYVVPVGRYWGVLAYGSRWFGGLVPRILRGLADFRFFLSILPLGKALRHFLARQ